MDKSRFERLYEETAIKLRRYVGSMIGWSPHLDDITQEAYLRVLTTAPARLSDSQLRSYLFTVATNIVRDMWRHGVVEGSWLPLEHEEASTTPDLDAIAGKMDLPKTLDSLTIMQRSLLWLAYAEGCSHREIAAITGIEEKSVKVLLFRARQKFISVYQKQNAAFHGTPR
jgi:RNA polymerase sigma-70 factor (ECF subfamily)